MTDSCDDPGSFEWDVLYGGCGDGTPDPPESDERLRTGLREGGVLCILGAIGLFAAGRHFLASVFIPLGILFVFVSVAFFTLSAIKSDDDSASVSPDEI